MLICRESFVTAAVLNPRLVYQYNPTPVMFGGLKEAFERMTDVHTAVLALQEAETFRRHLGEFASELAIRMATDPNTTPGNSTGVLLFLSSRTRT